MASREKLRNQARHRAANCCEYCRLPQDYVSTPFQVDHIIAEKHAGKSTPENIAWSCLNCNAFKGSNIAGKDDASGGLIPLYHPRNDVWQEHFEWKGGELIGRTAVGRVTIDVLRINLDFRVAVRESLMAEGVFPKD